MLTATHAPNAQTITITVAQLRGLHDGQDAIVSDGSNRIAVVPHRSILRQSFLAGIRSTALPRLHSGHAQVHTGVKFADQAAIEILGRGRFPVTGEPYYVVPRTYQPLGLVQRFADATISVRFTATSCWLGRSATTNS